MYFAGCKIFVSLSRSLCTCRSFIEISNGALSKSQTDDGIQAMLKAAGFENKELIAWEDFHFLLRDHEKELQFSELNVKGPEENPLNFKFFSCHAFSV